MFNSNNSSADLQKEREEVKSLLMKQLNRLSDESDCVIGEDLAQYSNAMVKIAYCMDDLFC